MSSEIRDEMEAAYTASEESSPSAPDVSTPESSTPDPVAAVPESTDATDTAPPPSDTGAVPEKAPGPIPFDRHQAVLAAERAKHAWAEKYGAPEAIQQRLAVTEWAERDPVGFLRTYAANQGIDLQQLMPQAPPPPPAQPELDVDVLFENGQTTFTGERVKQLLAIKEQQILDRVNQELAPIKQERAVSQLQQQALGHAKQQLATAVTWPGFKEHEADMKAFLKANPHATLNDAYINVVPAKLAGKVAEAETKAYQKALTDLQTKAGAASIPAPRTAGTPATDTSSMSLRDHLEAALGG